jgi:hypothetical protein
MTGHGIVHINYKLVRVQQFEHTVLLTWFDLLGKLGGICSITFGGSIISIIEIVYFFTGRFGTELIQKFQQIRKVKEFTERNMKANGIVLVGPYNQNKETKPIFNSELPFD